MADNSNKKYSGKTAHPLAKLKKRADVSVKELLTKLAIAEANVMTAIVRCQNPAYAKNQRDLYNKIRESYFKLCRQIDQALKSDVASAATDAYHRLEDELGSDGLVRWDEERAKRYWQYVAPEQSQSLAAVYTDKMAESAITSLRQALIETERQASIEGWTMNEKQKALQAKWLHIAGQGGFGFTDQAGRSWEHARYLQMLTRTTAQRVYNDSYLDRVAENGIKLVRVTALGAPECEVCRAWQGVICSIDGTARGLPSIESAKAAGVFHPNCVCIHEAVIEEVDKTELAIQRKHPFTKDIRDLDAYEARKFAIDRERYERKGLSAEEARIAVNRDNLELAIRNGLIRSDAREIVDGLTDTQVASLCPDGKTPRFEPVKKGDTAKIIRGSRGGVVHISRNATVEDLVKVTRLEDAKKPEPVKVEQPKPKEDLPVDFDNLPQDQKKALEWYVSGEGQYINQALRGRVGADFGDLTEEERASIDAIRKATNHPLDESIKTLYRSVDASAIFGNISEMQYESLCDYFLSSGADRKYYEKQIGGILERSRGKEIEEKGFMSTTHDKSIALEWGSFTGSDHPVTLELKVAPGTKGIDLKKLDVEDMQQKEVLLHTGIKYRITEITHVDGMPYIKAEIIGVKKPDVAINSPNGENSMLDGQKLADRYQTKTHYITNESNQKALEKAIDDVGKRIRNFDVEHMVVLNPNGTLRFDEFISTSNGGPIPNQWKGKLEGATLIHNHPGLGDGLSDKDIFTAKIERLRTIQAVSKIATYTLTVNKWPTMNKLQATWNRIDSEVTEELSKSDFSLIERMLVIQDRVVARLAKELNFSYNTIYQ